MVLNFVTQAIAKRYFEENKVPEATRLAWAGYRKPGAEAVRDDLVYKARPVNESQRIRAEPVPAAFPIRRAAGKVLDGQQALRSGPRWI